MFKLNAQEIVSTVLDDIASQVGTAVQDSLAEVKSRVNHHLDKTARATQGGTRRYDYDTTPGSLAQSYGAWHRGVADKLADDRRTARKNPTDRIANFKFAISTMAYAAAGDAFSDIVVHASAVPGSDPLARPPLDEKQFKNSRTLRPEHLTPEMQEAVLDVVSGEPDRLDRGKQALRAILGSGTEADMQIAAAMIGQIGDPFNTSKLNRLAEGIRKGRWSPPAHAGDRNGAPAGAKPTPVDPNVDPKKIQHASKPTPAEIVTLGGDHARRIIPHRQSADDFLDGPERFYGEDD